MKRVAALKRETTGSDIPNVNESGQGCEFLHQSAANRLFLLYVGQLACLGMTTADAIATGINLHALADRCSRGSGVKWLPITRQAGPSPRPMTRDHAMP